MPNVSGNLIKVLKKAKEKAIKLAKMKDSNFKLTDWLLNQWKTGILKPLFAWVTWLMVGMLFYANMDYQHSYAKGFYYAVNVGYSIGWGVLHEYTPYSKFFSICFLLIGATAISGWLAYFIETTIGRSDAWYETISLERHLETEVERRGCLGYIYANVVTHAPKIGNIILWSVYITFGTIWSCSVIGWPFIDGLYFATSSLSTGGLWGIPPDSPDWMFCFVGVFACTGIPVMGMAMGDLAALIVSSNKESQIQSVINSTNISPKEVEMLAEINLDDGDRLLDKNEYALLTLVRLNMVDGDLITRLFDKFDQMDAKKAGVLPLHNIFHIAGEAGTKRTAAYDAVHNPML